MSLTTTLSTYTSSLVVCQSRQHHPQTQQIINIAAYETSQLRSRNVQSDASPDVRHGPRRIGHVVHRHIPQPHRPDLTPISETDPKTVSPSAHVQYEFRSTKELEEESRDGLAGSRLYKHRNCREARTAVRCVTSATRATS